MKPNRKVPKEGGSMMENSGIIPMITTVSIPIIMKIGTGIGMNVTTHATRHTTPLKWVAQNLLASNLGLTAKLGNDKRINVYITDLNSISPNRWSKY